MSDAIIDKRLAMTADSKPGVDWAIVRQRFEAGESANSIGLDVGITRQAIFKRAKKGVWRKQGALKPIESHQTGARGLASPTRMNGVIEAVERGLTLAQAAAVIGVHRNTVRHWREGNEDFADAVEAAEARRIETQLNNMLTAAKTDWRASHQLLRAFDKRFSDARGDGHAPAVTVHIGSDRSTVDDFITIEG